jgi:hypothetical protein
MQWSGHALLICSWLSHVTHQDILFDVLYNVSCTNFFTSPRSRTKTHNAQKEICVTQMEFRASIHLALSRVGFLSVCILEMSDNCREEHIVILSVD